MISFQKNASFPSPMDRRRFLRSVGAGAIAAPFLRSGLARAEGPPPPRLLIFFSPNGTNELEWGAEGTGRDFRLRPILQPLEPVRDRILIPAGIDLQSNRKGPGKIHALGMGHLLTARELNEGPWTNAGFATGPSIDQVIANQVGGETLFRSLELGVQTDDARGATVWSRMAYRGNDQALPPENNPFDAFERIFGEGFSGMDRSSGAERRAQRRSVLDAVQADFQRLARRLGSSDRERLDIHLETVRELEQRLEDLASAPVFECDAPNRPTRFDPGSNDQFPAVLDMQADIVQAAFACDLTRVVTLQCSRAIGTYRFPWLPEVEFDHHRLSHKNIRRYGDQYRAVGQWYARQFKGLIDRLAAIPEGDGSVLDNTLIVWVSEIKKGVQHSRTDMPFLLAGNIGGQFDMGRSIQLSRSHSDMWLTVARAFGLEIETFGDPDFNQGVISEFMR